MIPVVGLLSLPPVHDGFLVTCPSISFTYAYLYCLFVHLFLFASVFFVVVAVVLLFSFHAHPITILDVHSTPLPLLLTCCIT